MRLGNLVSLSLSLGMLRFLFIQVAELGEVETLIHQLEVYLEWIIGLCKHGYQVFGYRRQRKYLINVIELQVDCQVVVGLVSRFEL